MRSMPLVLDGDDPEARPRQVLPMATDGGGACGTKIMANIHGDTQMGRAGAHRTEDWHLPDPLLLLV